MFPVLKRCAVAWVALFLVCVACPCLAKDKPTLEQVKALVERRLTENPKYHPGSLISLETVEPIFNELNEMGFRLSGDSGAEELYDSFLRDTDYLVVASHMSEGRRFMYVVSDIPGAYDLMERLSWSAEGRKILHDLIVDQDGAAKFQQLLTPAGLKALKKQLARDPGSRNFGTPTGHIHTANDLKSRLDELMVINTRN